jgi:tRNA(fMet)-specific endonuclease VapC
MSRFLLDTDTITLIQYGHARLVKRLANYPSSDIAISALSIQEQMRGWLARLSRLSKPPQIADWYEFLAKRMFPVWQRHELSAFPESAISRFEHLKTLRLNIGLMDLRIAAVALDGGTTVVTRNLCDFTRVPGLVAEDWSV